MNEIHFYSSYNCIAYVQYKHKNYYKYTKEDVKLTPSSTFLYIDYWNMLV